MKICVVGASGVLGRALVPMLTRQGDSVRALARFKKERVDFFPREVDCRFCDLLSEDVAHSLTPLLEGCEAVIHAATRIPSDFTAPGAWDANTRLRVEGTQRLVEASVAAGVQIYVQQSIVMAYPDSGDRWIEEDTPLDTSPERSAVCSPVISMERIVKSDTGNTMRWCILREGMFVGKGTFQDVLIKQLLAGEPTLPGDGWNFVSPVHVNDVASAFDLALRSAPAGSTFNIVAEPLRQGDYTETLANIVGAPKPRRIEAGRNPPSFRCSNRAARQSLGWTPRHSIYPTHE